jgi:fucose permease
VLTEHLTRKKYMTKSHTHVSSDPLQQIRWLTYMMFFMFAMTSDAVGMIIPELIK